MKTFVLRRALAIAKKEAFHILRDPITLIATLGLPIFMVIVFGVSIEFNVKNIALAVNDSDKTQSSRRLIETFSSSEYFIVKDAPSPSSSIAQMLTNKARAALIIPPNFQRNLLADRPADLQILLDGSDNSTVVPILSYIKSIESLASARLANFQPDLPYAIQARYLFNPELNSTWFIIPGLCVIVLSIITVILTALTVAREYENGSIELLLSTPVQPLEIIIGKILPYGILGFINLFIIYIFARTFFGIPFLGNHLVFVFGALLFLTAYSMQGILVSVVTRSQLLAMQLAIISAYLPTQLLSGFIFPIESMPKGMQYFTAILPVRWFMKISRDLFLQGTEFIELWLPFVALAIFCLVMTMLAVRKFKRDLET